MNRMVAGGNHWLINNLLTNDVKYLLKRKFIEAKCEATGQKVRVSIEDDGMGIKAEGLDKLYNFYYQVVVQYLNYLVNVYQ